MQETLLNVKLESFGEAMATSTDQMLMFDRISEINDSGGKYSEGKISAELDINLNFGSSIAILKVIP